ncbi:MAG TPA: formimidoylglutamase [Flavobacteriaceae bacterium]|nr:formimidoylglutamase [Flavobacteriaceae bacterium]
MEFDFLKPVSNTLLEEATFQHKSSLWQKIEIHSEDKGFPDLNETQIALFGVLENRREEKRRSTTFDFDGVRKAFYGLFPGNWNLKIADLGDIQAGATVEDTYFAVQNLVSELLKRKIIPIILGGSQDLTYPQYRAYDNYGQMVNLVNIDACFDLGDAGETISNKSYVGKMVVDQPYNLFNYSNIGYQTYYNPQDEIELMDRLFFDAYRLGEVSAKIDLVEPVMRDADLVVMDISSVKYSEIHVGGHHSPNGFDGKELCALSRYAGISDKISSFGIYELQKLENSPASAMLIAQIIWYFIEGTNYRKGENIVGSNNNFIRYQVPIENETLTFYKSELSERWWIELPFLPNVNNKLKKHTLLPCTYQDYLGACDQEIPERWYKARRKNEF